MRRLLGSCALALLAAAPGCVRFNYRWLNLHEPIEQAQIDRLSQALAAGEVELQACLDELGAPVLVWSAPRGIALAYGWQDKGAWTVHVGYTWQWVFRLQVDYSSAVSHLDGMVLWFDDDLRLVALERGHLRDLVQRHRPEPQDAP
jgi:hypothetical protein